MGNFFSCFSSLNAAKEDPSRRSSSECWRKTCTREQVDVDYHCETNEQQFLGSKQRSENKYSAGQQFMSLDIVWSTLEKMSALVVRTVSWIKLCPSVNACLFHFRRRNVFSKNMSYSKSSHFGILYCFVTSLMMQRLLNMQKSKRENYDKKPLHLLWIIQVKRYL